MSKEGRTDPRAVLEAYRAGRLSLEDAVSAVDGCYFQDIGHTTLDHDRHRRTGTGEVIYGGHKTPEQIRDAFVALAARGNGVLATRVGLEAAALVLEAVPGAEHHPNARIVMLRGEREPAAHTIAVVTAGTSDLPVAEEAALTCEFLGNTVKRISDVGVAGIHRILSRAEELRRARVVIVVAGMEGALPSVVGGLVDKPVIAVPTSVGYGAAFGGIAALLGMLNSCASGVSVVNIDNGFGAGFLASRINRL
ncbi:MAG: nickel pincer cofactor biosynthesis protein LarB [Alphaproteobacteria bacterium]|nr:nickel pincer cofactor biosynthesis protein LarB [Alphaproteobacteria bacterium]